MQPFIDVDDDDIFDDDVSLELNLKLTYYKPSKVSYKFVKGKYVLQKDLTIEFGMNTPDAPMIVDKYRLKIKRGFKIGGSPFPAFLKALFPDMGTNNLYNSAAFFITALYESAGFNEFGREDCDKFYLGIVNGLCKNPFLRVLRKVAATVFIGSNLVWDDGKDEITHVTLDYLDSDD